MGIDLGRFKSKKSNDEWVDWLADDPVPASMRQRMRTRAVQRASRPIRRSPGGTTQPQQKNTDLHDSRVHSISINLQLPDTKKLKAKTKQLYQSVRAKPSSLIAKYPRQLMIGSGVLAACIVVVGVVALSGSDGKGGQGSLDDSANGVLSEQSAKPDFAYSVPKGDETEASGAVRYDADKKVVNFEDSIGGVNIVVSQQPLPEAFKDDTDNRVKKMAEDFAATEVISTSNPTAYLGNDIKGPQTVIFAKKDLLVFIQSAKKIDNHDWAEYITNLK